MPTTGEKCAKNLDDLRSYTKRITDLIEIANTFLPPELYFMAVDSDSVVLFASNNWFDLYGCKPNELVGESFFKWVDESNYEQTMEYWNSYKDLPLPDGELFKSVNKRKNGSLVELTWKQMEIAPIGNRSIFYGVCEVCEMVNN